jgi:hypothetical protein
MLFPENLTDSEPSSTLSAAALALIRRDRIQQLTNQLRYIHGLKDWERDLLLQELQALEAESNTSGI